MSLCCAGACVAGLTRASGQRQLLGSWFRGWCSCPCEFDRAMWLFLKWWGGGCIRKSMRGPVCYFPLAGLGWVVCRKDWRAASSVHIMPGHGVRPLMQFVRLTMSRLYRPLTSSGPPEPLGHAWADAAVILSWHSQGPIVWKRFLGCVGTGGTADSQGCVAPHSGLCPPTEAVGVCRLRWRSRHGCFASSVACMKAR